MFTIKTLNAISPVGLAKLNKNLFDVSVGTDAPDGILVRSADLLNTTFNDNLLAIARAGAGVNNIPLDRCSEQGIVVFNTPGANANAVAELVIGMLIAGSRNVADAAQWTQGLAGDAAMAKSVEKGKKQFVGNEIKGKTLGVVGLGAIGSRVANCAIALGMEVYGYDPYISIDAAWNLSSQVHHCVNLNDMLPLCDYITLHVPYLPTTKDTINAQTLALCKDGVRILNYARGELVNTPALLDAMETGKVSGYMTDFPTEAILGKPGIVCTPHLGASTPEAEDNCAAMAAQDPHWKLLLVGTGEMEPEMRAAAARRGLTDRVIFAGVQSDVPAFMNAFDLFLLPSNFEGSPVTLVEAQGCGVPCLASTNVPDDGSVTDLVHFLPLAAPLTDWAAKAEAIAAHGDHDDHWAALSAAGYELKTAARRMEQLYDKLGGHA